jgi:hypothetical protein
MGFALALAALALRAGLRLRGARRRGARRPPGEYRRHLRLAKPAVLALALGYLGGPASMWWLRGREPFGTAHALAGSVALALFVAAAVLGRRLERGRTRRRDLHGALALLACAAAAAAAVTGLVLLP